ncbi:MAG: hypothetical protein M4579_006465 [Chaenotheca gracillima]|nr:MAG: hypothetical protein M4579_006465 [Chaenotheca gracillima]
MDHVSLPYLISAADYDGPKDYIEAENNHLTGTTVADFATALMKRAMSHIQYHQFNDLKQKDRESAEERAHLFEKLKKIIPILTAHPRIAQSCSSVLWHTDLHSGNIFVSSDDPTVIKGIIDWQSSTVSPMFLQCRVPTFLEPPMNFPPGAQAPELPDDFDQLNTIGQQQAVLERDLAERWKMYEMYTWVHNPDAFDALGVDRILTEPMARCGEWSYETIVPLRRSLMCLRDNWGHLGLLGECPLTFTKKELEKHEEESQRYLDWLYLLTIASGELSTDSEGWVPCTKWNAVMVENQRLFDIFVDMMAVEISKEEAMEMWPFSDKVSLVK